VSIGTAATKERAGVRRATVAPAHRAAIRRRLLHWYDRHKRDLPWRRRRSDPYAQWVAEIMLQQTRVETVLGYYERFLRRFPTLRDLADANHQEVLKHWEGLGYYRRIFHLHRAARSIRDAGGTVPATSVGLRALPGVGDYTAAAIASIAFNEPVAAVDGNVARVFARLFAVKDDIRAAATQTHVTKLAQALLSPKRPGDFTQAWMDLGSSVCTPKSPRCPHCPLTSLCRAAAMDLADTLPVITSKGKSAKQSFVVSILMHDRKMLVRRRTEGGLWSGLWEFPTIECVGRAAPCGLVRQLMNVESLTPLGRPRKVGVVRRELTHRSLSFHVFAVPVRDAPHSRKRTDRRWVTSRMFERLAVSTAHRCIYAAFTDSAGAPPGWRAGKQSRDRKC
jgi:A/G-specific adenine glycosylase